EAASHPCAREPAGRLSKPEIPRLEARQPPGPPRRRLELVMNEALPAVLALAIAVGGRQHLLVIGERLVLGRAADLDHLEPGRALEHPVTDRRWLQHAVAGS